MSTSRYLYPIKTKISKLLVINQQFPGPPTLVFRYYNNISSVVLWAKCFCDLPTSTNHIYGIFMRFAIAYSTMDSLLYCKLPVHARALSSSEYSNKTLQTNMGLFLIYIIFSTMVPHTKNFSFCRQR